jgi:hypothetical protein
MMGARVVRAFSLIAMSMVAALAAGVSLARAAEADGFAKRMFDGGLAAKGKTRACFVRHYDAAHLARHPKQTVSAMRIMIEAEMVPEDQAANYSFRMGVKFRDRKDNYDSGGDCGHPSAYEESADKLHLGCGVDCDGGGLSVELTNSDKSVLVRLGNLAIWNSDKPDAERDSFGGGDDQLFRLDRVGMEQCRSLLIDADEPPATN